MFKEGVHVVNGSDTPIESINPFVGIHSLLNRQGPDAGYQYRSAIYYQNETEKKIAEAFRDQLEAEKAMKLREKLNSKQMKNNRIFRILYINSY